MENVARSERRNAGAYDVTELRAKLRQTKINARLLKLTLQDARQFSTAIIELDCDNELMRILDPVSDTLAILLSLIEGWENSA